jgi:hypothetical protein
MSDPYDTTDDDRAYEGPDVETSTSEAAAQMDDRDAAAEDENVAPAGGDKQTEEQLEADNAVERDTISSLEDDAGSA